MFVQRDGYFRPCCPYVGGTVAFLGGGVEGELADNQYLAVCFKNGFVHYAVFVIENAQVDYLLAKPVDIFFSIGFFDAYEYHEALSNGGFAGSVDGDGSVSGTLYHYSHVVLVFLRGQSYELIRCVHGSAG